MINSENYNFNQYINYNIDKNDIKWEYNIDCSLCKEFSNRIKPSIRYKTNKTCIVCILNGLLNENKKNIAKISLNKINIPEEDKKIFMNLFNLFHNFTFLISEIIKKSKNKNTNLKFLEEENLINFFDEFFSLYDFILNQKSFLGLKNYWKIKKLIENKCVLEFNKNRQYYDNLIDNLKNLFKGIEINEDINEKLSLNRTLKVYNLPNYNLFKIFIKETNFIENFYYYELIVGENEKIVYDNILELMEKKNKNILFDKSISIGDLIRNNIRILFEFGITNFRNISQNEIYNLSLIAVLKSINLLKLFPLMIDPSIEEIYLDNPNDEIYVDHQLYRRCKTNIRLNQIEIDCLKTNVRLISKKRLDYKNPSIKCTLNDSIFNLRICIDIKPLSLSDFSLDIRTMKKNILTLPKLIKLGTLSPKIAGFLYFMIINGKNITTLGRTSTGKTTLINSLDILVPRSKRKIYVEEAPESLDLLQINNHQVKYVVEKDSKSEEKYTKSKIITNLLHRNPDIIYLGEILSIDEAKAMFHCLSVGLKGFQTIHANSIDALINRWIFHFNIEPSCFNDLDILIHMEMKNNVRFINEISIIRFNNNEINKEIIFKFEPNENNWVYKENILQLFITRELVLNTNEITEIEEEIKFYSNIFEYLKEIEMFDIKFQSKIFQDLYRFILKIKKDNSTNWKYLENEFFNKNLKGLN